MLRKVKLGLLLALGFAGLSLLLPAGRAEAARLMSGWGLIEDLNGVAYPAGGFLISTAVATGQVINPGRVVKVYCDVYATVGAARDSSGTIRHADGGSAVMTPLTGVPVAPGIPEFIATESVTTHIAAMTDGGTGYCRLLEMR